MGYDCTLHLVDEHTIREEFIPWLLGQSPNEIALDRILENAGELRNTVREALKNDDPDAAKMLCQLAIMFSACVLPHQYERGFALGLLQNREKGIARAYPDRFAFSPEPLFTKVVDEYPRLHGHFPVWFTGNYSTGVFIPSEHVPEVLAWVEANIADLTEEDPRQFRGLLGILRAAADRHLAYWEATDLAIPMVDVYPGDPSLMQAQHLGNEPGTPGHHLEEAPLEGHWCKYRCVVLDDWLISADFPPFVTNFWDLSVWPPRLVHSLSEYAPYLTRVRDGRWLLFSETDSTVRPFTFRPRLFSDLDKDPDGVFPVGVAGAEWSIEPGGFFQNRLVVFRDPPRGSGPGDPLPMPLWAVGQDWRPIPGLPPEVVGLSPSPYAVARPVSGIVPLNSDNDVLLWNGDGYELQGDVFEKTFALELKNALGDWTSVPAGTDGFFYLSRGNLFEIHRGSEKIAHAEKWTNIRYVRPGPAGSLLLQEGDNRHGDVGKLYFPDDGTFIHIKPELFDDKDYPFLTWSASTDRFVVVSDRFLSIPTSVVLSLPRFHAHTGKQVKIS
jgi:hypothetical protein